jgi:hypothetical protein
MQIDLTLEDEDQHRVYEVTVNARVVAEIGGSPGYCCDVNSVQLNDVIVYFDGDWGCPVVIEADRRQFIERYVERKFNAEIVARCIEAFEERRAVA